MPLSWNEIKIRGFVFQLAANYTNAHEYIVMLRIKCFLWPHLPDCVIQAGMNADGHRCFFLPRRLEEQ